jgi:hypothetical protein
MSHASPQRIYDVDLDPFVICSFAFGMTLSSILCFHVLTLARLFIYDGSGGERRRML